MKPIDFICNERAFEALVEAHKAYKTYLDVLVEEEVLGVSVILKSYDESKKIAVIKEVRSITGLGLKEVKNFVESSPCLLRTGISKDEARRIERIITAAGGMVTIEASRRSWFENE